MLPRTLLVAGRAFDEGLSARRVAAAVARGFNDGGWQTDECPLDDRASHGGPSTCDGRAPSAQTVRALLDSLDFDARLHRARALIVCERTLREDALAGSLAFEVATRARQGGVPAYAITASNRLDSFDARVLDLQAIVEAGGAHSLAGGERSRAAAERSLRAAGRKLANLV